MDITLLGAALQGGFAWNLPEGFLAVIGLASALVLATLALRQAFRVDDQVTRPALQVVEGGKQASQAAA